MICILKLYQKIKIKYCPMDFTIFTPFLPLFVSWILPPDLPKALNMFLVNAWQPHMPQRWFSPFWNQGTAENNISGNWKAFLYICYTIVPPKIKRNGLKWPKTKKSYRLLFKGVKRISKLAHSTALKIG